MFWSNQKDRKEAGLGLEQTKLEEDMVVEVRLCQCGCVADCGIPLPGKGLQGISVYEVRVSAHTHDSEPLSHRPQPHSLKILLCHHFIRSSL